MLRLVVVLAALSASAAAAAPPKQTVSVRPSSVYVLQLTHLTGKHWSRASSCSGKVALSIRLATGRVQHLRAVKIGSLGGFRVGWAPPRLSNGRARVNASEACRHSTLRATTTLIVLGTP